MHNNLTKSKIKSLHQQILLIENLGIVEKFVLINKILNNENDEQILRKRKIVSSLRGKSKFQS
jgi:hypothetical protein